MICVLPEDYKLYSAGCRTGSLETVVVLREPTSNKETSINHERGSHFITVLSSTNRANTLTTASCSRAICSSNSSSGS